MGLIQPGHPNSPLVEMSPVSDVVIDVPAEAPIYVEPIDAEKTVDEADLVVAVSDEESVEVTKLSNKQLARELSDIALSAVGVSMLHARVGQRGLIPTKVIKPFVTRTLSWLLNDGNPKRTGVTTYSSDKDVDHATKRAIVDEYVSRLSERKAEERG